MEQLFVVILGVLILLTSTVFSAVRGYVQRSRARKARRSTNVMSGASDTNRHPAVNNGAMGIAPHKPTRSRTRTSLSALPVSDVIERERALRDQMRIDGVTPGEVDQYGADTPGTTTADATAPAVNSGLSAAPAASKGISRIRSLPPLKQAIIWSELLSKPLAERDPAQSNGFHD